MLHHNGINFFLDGLLVTILVLLLGMIFVSAEEDCAHIVDATAAQDSAGTWVISAAVSSTETGWDKYADEWRVENPADGSLLGTRELLHPHVNEQPFTRSLSGVEIPDDVYVVVISARDSVLGYCGESFQLVLRETEAPEEEELESTMTASSFNGTSTFANETVGGNFTFEIISSIEKQQTTTLIKDSDMEESSAMEHMNETVSGSSRTSPGGKYFIMALVSTFGWILLLQ